MKKKNLYEYIRIVMTFEIELFYIANKKHFDNNINKSEISISEIIPNWSHTYMKFFLHNYSKIIISCIIDFFRYL